MGVDRVQKRITREAISPANRDTAGTSFANRRKPCRIVRAAVTTDCVAAGVPKIRIVKPELSVVENVESFRAKFEHSGFADREVFQEAQIEVESSRIVEEVASSSSEGKPAWRCEGTGISQQGAKASGVVACAGGSSVGMANDVRIRSGADPVCHPGIVEYGNCGAATVDHAERGPRLIGSDSGKLPTISQEVEQARRSARRHWILSISGLLTGATERHVLQTLG